MQWQAPSLWLPILVTIVPLMHSLPLALRDQYSFDQRGFLFLHACLYKYFYNRKWMTDKIWGSREFVDGIDRSTSCMPLQLRPKRTKLRHRYVSSLASRLGIHTAVFWRIGKMMRGQIKIFYRETKRQALGKLHSEEMTHEECTVRMVEMMRWKIEKSEDDQASTTRRDIWENKIRRSPNHKAANLEEGRPWATL